MIIYQTEFRMSGNEKRKRKYVHKQVKMESQRNVTYHKNQKKIKKQTNKKTKKQ